MSDGVFRISNRLYAPPRLNLPTSPRQIINVLIVTLITQIQERGVQHVEILPVLAARPFAFQDVLGELLWILRAHELRVLWEADVYETVYRTRLGRGRNVWGDRGRVEWRVLDAVAIHLSDIQVVFNFRGVRGGYVVGGAPDLFRRGGVLRSMY